MKYNLINDYYIRKFDERNFVLAKMEKIKTGKKAGSELEKIDGYFSTLEGAWNGAVDRLSLNANDFKELKELVNDLKNLKLTWKN